MPTFSRRCTNSAPAQLLGSSNRGGWSYVNASGPSDLRRWYSAEFQYLRRGRLNPGWETGWSLGPQETPPRSTSKCVRRCREGPSGTSIRDRAFLPPFQGGISWGSSNPGWRSKRSQPWACTLSPTPGRRTDDDARIPHLRCFSDLRTGVGGPMLTRRVPQTFDDGIRLNSRACGEDASTLAGKLVSPLDRKRLRRGLRQNVYGVVRKGQAVRQFATEHSCRPFRAAFHGDLRTQGGDRSDRNPGLVPFRPLRGEGRV